MKAAVLTVDGFRLENEALPAIGDNEVLVKTVGCGICTGDLFVYRQRAELAATPVHLGHEASGQVVAIGHNVVDVAVGDLVTSLSAPAYAENFVAAQDELVKIPPGVDPMFALGEPIACCVHAANRFGIAPQDSVAIIGCGFMGLVCQQLAAHQGAGLICAVDPIAERREMSRQLGADIAYDPETVGGAEILAQHGPFDVVIEAVGVQSALDLSTELVAEHGRIVLIGYHQSHGGLRAVNMQQWNYKAIDVVNGHVRRLDEKVAAMRQGMDLVQQNQLILEPLVTVYTFEQIADAFRDLNEQIPGLFKAVLKMA